MLELYMYIVPALVIVVITVGITSDFYTDGEDL